MSHSETPPLGGMTGYARRELRLDDAGLAWELRTVNHRYLDLSVRLPEEFRPLEQQVREALGGALARGKVEATLRLLPGEAEGARLDLDQALLAELLGALSEVRRQMPDPGPLDPMSVLSWPGVLRPPERDLTPLRSRCLALLGEALEDLLQARRREGVRIASLLRARADAIEGIVRELRGQAGELRERLRSRLHARLKGLEVTVDDGRLEQELALQLTRLDVDEELDRLDGHVADLRHALGEGGPVGRRLDFLMQEFNREANTLASKSQESQATRAAVELKVLIEQMREQVQNLE